MKFHSSFKHLTCESIFMKKNKSTVFLHNLGCVLNGISVKATLVLLLISHFENVIGQETTALRRNTIKLDLTSNLLFRNALNISYERVRRPNQTYAITLGYQEFPKLVSIGSG